MNLRTIFISSFLSLSSLGVLAQERINLSGTWQFAFAANQKEADRLERFYTSDFAKNKFKSTPVPSNWALLGYEEPVYGHRLKFGSTGTNWGVMIADILLLLLM